MNQPHRVTIVLALVGRLRIATVPALAAVWAVAGSVQAQEVPVYYDFVENGELRGGKIILDRSNPEHRRTFGLDLPDGFLRTVWPSTTIIDSGPTSNRIDLVMLGDGYTQNEIESYAAHVDTVITDFLSEGVIGDYASYFNVHRVDVTSNKSGVDEIDLGIFRDTTLDMAYGCFGIDRLLCINISKALAAAASAPETDQVLALANSTRYGGAGYPADDLGTLAGNNSSSIEVALHEFGHSFADLADEYDYADGATYAGPEPIEPNVSIFDAGTQTAQQLKWYRWMDLAFVDTFEGAMYHEFGIYRPTSGSKMRFLGQPYQSINDEQFVFNIYQIVSPIDDATPPSSSPLAACTQFFVLPMQPTAHTLDVQWSIDGIEVPGATATTFTPDPASLQPGTHQVRVEVADNTTLVRDETRRATLMTEARQWEIDVSIISEESNAAGNCGDGIDNDCDGQTDAGDAECAAPGCPFMCGDIDGSGGNVTLVDFASFALCFGRPPSVSIACQCSDLDGNGSNNLVDFATFSLAFGGASTNTPPNCP